MMTDKERELLNMGSLARPDIVSVEGFQLRPLSFGSFTILELVGNEFLAPRGDFRELEVGGKMVQRRDVKAQFYAVAEYVFVHGAPLGEVQTKAFGSLEDFRIAVLAYADQHLRLHQVKPLGAEIKRSFEEFEAAQFDVKEEGDERKGPERPNS